MKRSPKLHPSCWDALVVCVVILLAVLSAVTIWGGEQESGELTVVISVDGEEVERWPLAEGPDKDGVYSYNGYTLKIGVSYPIYPDVPCIRVVESDCPTQDCVHTGEIGRHIIALAATGHCRVCLPVDQQNILLILCITLNLDDPHLRITGLHMAYDRGLGEITEIITHHSTILAAIMADMV